MAMGALRNISTHSGQSRSAKASWSLAVPTVRTVLATWERAELYRKTRLRAENQAHEPSILNPGEKRAAQALAK